VLTEKAFSQALRRLRPGLRDAQRTIGNEPKWCWLGIGLRHGHHDGPPRAAVHTIHRILALVSMRMSEKQRNT
jgi:hypothetical protein